MRTADYHNTAERGPLFRDHQFYHYQSVATSIRASKAGVTPLSAYHRLVIYSTREYWLCQRLQRDCHLFPLTPQFYKHRYKAILANFLSSNVEGTVGEKNTLGKSAQGSSALLCAVIKVISDIVWASSVFASRPSESFVVSTHHWLCSTCKGQGNVSMA